VVVEQGGWWGRRSRIGVMEEPELELGKLMKVEE